jgi:hypothetical protein
MNDACAQSARVSQAHARRDSYISCIHATGNPGASARTANLLPARLAAILTHKLAQNGGARPSAVSQEANARILLDRIVNSPAAGDLNFQ